MGQEQTFRTRKLGTDFLSGFDQSEAKWVWKIALTVVFGWLLLATSGNQAGRIRRSVASSLLSFGYREGVNVVISSRQASLKHSRGSSAPLFIIAHSSGPQTTSHLRLTILPARQRRKHKRRPYTSLNVLPCFYRALRRPASASNEPHRHAWL